MKNIVRMRWLMPILVFSLVCSFNLTAAAQNYYPSATGNMWTLTSVDGTEQRTYSLEAPDIEVGEGIVRLKIATATVGTDTVDIDNYYVTVDAEGIKLHQSITDEGAFGIAEAQFDPPASFFPLPLAAGDAWQIVAETELKLVGATTSTTSAEVVALETVTTPAGTFDNCVKIQLNRRVVTRLVTTRSTSYQWLAPDVGPVKYQNDQDVVYELTNYNVLPETPVVEEPIAEEMETPEVPETEEPADEETGGEEPAAEETVETVEPVAPEEPADEETGAEEPAAEETDGEEPTTEEPADEETDGEEPAAEETVETVEPVAPEEPATGEQVMPAGPSFELALEPGLNLISVPLMPAEPYTAKSLADMLGATVVIKLDSMTKEFVAYSIAEGDDGFAIGGDRGYIVNTPAGGMVTFTGEAWTNLPAEKPDVEAPAVEEPAAEEPVVVVEPAAEEPVVAETPAAEEPAEEPVVVVEPAAEEPVVAETPAAEEPAEEPVVAEGEGEAPAAPALRIYNNAWAFVVTSDLQGMEAGASYTVVAENLRTGIVTTKRVTGDAQRSSAAWADLNRKSVVEAGDKLEVALYDARGTIVSGPFQRTVTTADIRNAYLTLQLRVGDVQPKDTILAQNFPNPFNPETWIPYQLSKSTEVTLQIYDISGRLVRTLELGWKPTGSYMTRSSAAYWDGRNELGERVASGTYFYTLQTQDFAATRRMVILK